MEAGWEGKLGKMEGGTEREMEEKVETIREVRKEEHRVGGWTEGGKS